MKSSVVIILSIVISSFSYGKYFNLKPEIFKCIKKTKEMKKWEKAYPKNHLFLNIPDHAISKNRLTPMNFEDRDLDRDINVTFTHNRYTFICSLAKGSVIQSSARIIINENSEIRETEIGEFNNDDKRVALKETKLFKSSGGAYLTSNDLYVSPDGVVKTFDGKYSIFHYQMTRNSDYKYYLIEGVTDYKIEPSNIVSKVVVK